MAPVNRYPMVCGVRDGRLREVHSLRSAVGLCGIPSPVISAVGAGGKTSSIRCLAQEYVERGQRVIVLTTTHMTAEDRPWFLLEPSEEKMR